MINPPPQAEVSILIPAYMASAFIDRTLFFARGQTFRDISIIISIDAGEDDTHDIAHHHAARDSRITVHRQKERLGWAGNVNFLLERVDTPYFFIYFHDDILLPQYTTMVLDRLEQHPEAAGAYCDMGHFGTSDGISAGPAYHGSVTRRLLTLMLAPERGSPLRAVMRSAKAGHIRLKDMANGGFWANEPFLMDLLVAGPVEHLAQVLYLRWDRREGGLTEGWRAWPVEAIIDGWKSNIETSLEVINQATQNESERRALRFALFVRVLPILQTLRDENDKPLVRSGADLHPVFSTLDTPDLLAPHGAEIQQWASERFASCRV